MSNSEKSRAEQLNDILHKNKDHNKDQIDVKKDDKLEDQNLISNSKENIDSGALDVTALQKQINELKAINEKLTEAANLAKDSELRMQAEMQNLVRRNSIDVQKARDFALEKFVKELVAVSDSFIGGLDHYKNSELSDDAKNIYSGFKLTYDLFINILDKFNIKKLDPVDIKFDPKFHEALSMQESSQHNSGIVIQVIQSGYILKDRVLRPARVIVSK